MALLAVLVMVIAKRLPNKTTCWIFLINIIVCCASYTSFGGLANADVALYVLTLLTAYILYLYPNYYVNIGLIPILAFLSLAKGTLLFIALTIISVITIHYFIHRKRLLAFCTPLVFSLSFIIIWVACGQTFGNLIDFWQGSIAFSKGYAENMAKYEPISIRVIGIFTVLCALSTIVIKNFYHVKNLSSGFFLSRIGLVAIEGIIVFIIWKHGFVRADGHMLTFLRFFACAYPLLFWLQPIFPMVSNANYSVFKNYTFMIITILSCGLWGLPYTPRLVINFKLLMDIKNYNLLLEEKLHQSISEMQMPQIQKIVGDKPIGHFGFKPSRMLYNHFKYKPMPATLSYVGWNQSNMKKDADFFRRDISAPLYLLYTLHTFGKGLSAQDDALAQLEIFQRYDPVLENSNSLLLKRRSFSPAISQETYIGSEAIYSINEWNEIPAYEMIPLRMKVTLLNGFISRMLMIFYKPSGYDIEYVLSNGTIKRHSFRPHMAEEGFLIAPLITNNKEFMAALSYSEYKKYLDNNSNILNRMVKFRIICSHLSFACTQKMKVSFEKVNGLELGRIH
ncbi:MAG: hypothetical protein V4525_09370 [Pseudomonadota bacterium]